LLESRQEHLRGLFAAEDLEGDVLLELEIERAENGPHATLADLRFQAIPRGDRRAGLELLRATRQHFGLRDHLSALRRLQRARDLLGEARIAADHGRRIA